MIILDGSNLSLDALESICYGHDKVSIHEESWQTIQQSYEYVQAITSHQKIVYGINTGFGKLANTLIEPEKLQALQLNLIRSHAIGTGDPLPFETVQAAMVIRLNSLIKGFSGVSKELVQLLLDCINYHVHPYVPSIGSLGASGDLAPLAHIALLLIGEGQCLLDQQKVNSLSILDSLNLHPVTLHPKEGLALINGTSVSTALMSVALIQIERILAASISASVLSMEGYCANPDAFHPLIHQAKIQVGQSVIAQLIRDMYQDSRLAGTSHRVQDPYSFRCIPQVMGPVLDAYHYCKTVNQLEMNSATDNPLIFTDQDLVISGGNFHAEPIALTADFMAMVLIPVGDISERRMNHLLNQNLSEDLPPFLAHSPGLHSGLMIAQYTAAALLSKCKTLVYPASATSVPVSADQEDVVSQAPNACMKLLSVTDCLARIVAIELLTSAQALEFRDINSISQFGKKIHQLVRSQSAPLYDDRSLHQDIENLTRLIFSGWFLKELPFDAI